MIPTLLKIRGFKSFAEQAQIPLGAGLSGIVGPNGCGKSNIVDALRWLMGESFAKRLRGDSNDDLLFNGSRDHHSMDIAEVQITLDPHSPAQDPQWQDVEEITVERRLVRGEGSTYWINGRQVLQRDVQLFFSDWGLSLGGSAIVGQGQVAAIIHARGEDRRILLEDVAGTRGLLVRRRESVSKLDAAQRNLERSEERIESERKQLSRLKSEARKEKQYRTLSDEIIRLRAIEMYATWRDNTKMLEEARAQLTQIQVSLDELASSRQELQEGRQQAANEYERISQELQGARNELDRAKITLERAADDFTRAQDERKNTEERLESLRDERDRQETRLEELSGELETEEEGASDNAAEQSATTALAEIKLEHQQNIDDEREAQRALAKLQHDIVTAEGKLKERAAEQQAKLEQRNRLEKEEKDHKAKLEVLNQKALAQEQEIKDLTEEGKAKQSQINEMGAKREKASSTVEERQRPLSKMRKYLEERNIDYDMQLGRLSDEEKTLKGSLHALKEYMGAHSADSADSDTSAVKQVRCDKHLTLAVAAALGWDGEAKIAKQAPDKPAHVWLKSDAKKVKFPANIKSLWDMVEHAPAQLETRLSSSGLTENLSEALAVRSDIQAGATLVTKDGWRVTFDGVISHVDAYDSSAKIMEAVQKYQELSGELGKIEAQKTKLDEAWQQDKAREEEKTEKQQDLVDRAAAELSDCEASLAELRKSEENRSRRLNQLQYESKRTLENKDWQKQRLEDISATLESMVEVDEDADLESGIESTRRKLPQHEEALRQAGEKLAASDRKRQEAQSKLMEQESQRAYRIKRAEDLRRSIEEAKRRLSEQEREEEKLTENLQKQQKHESLEEIIAAAKLAVKERAAVADKFAERITSSESALRAAESKENDQREHVAEIEQNRARLEERVSQFEVARIEIKQRVEREFNNNDPERLCELHAFTRDVEADENISETINDKIRLRDRIGAVNLLAAEQVQEFEQELGSLKHERDRLLEAIGELRASIGEIDSQATESITRAFSELNQEFHDIFVRIFAGGRAKLELTNPENLLESGLEILACPPGKRLTSLNLLSGGEQALTALSLLLARFKLSPAPVCVLDEVDAALDDSNVKRLLELLEEIFASKANGASTNTSANTSTDQAPNKDSFNAAAGQVCCLIITHHRITMSRAQKLIGVTMQTPGVTSIVNVSLDQAMRYSKTKSANTSESKSGHANA